MSLPIEFIAVYTCEVCGEEYDMYNCRVPYVMLWCDECSNITRYLSDKVIHMSWEWDYIEED